MPSEVTIDLILNKLDFKPYAEQRQILLDQHSSILIKGGWRASKSTVSTLYLLTRYWLGKYYALIGADYELCRPEFSYLFNWAKKLGILIPEKSSFPSRDKCILALSRGDGAEPTIVETKSAKYPEKIAGRAYDGALMCEAAQLPFGVFEIVQGRLAETEGWLIMSGTLEAEADWYVDKSREYQLPDNVDNGVAYSLPSWVNKKIFPEGRNSPILKQKELQLGKDRFMMRYGGEVPLPKGLVFPEFLPRLHTGNFSYKPGAPVYLGIDPGYDPGVYSVLFIQFINDEVYVFDEIYEHRLITDQIIQIIKSKRYYDKIEEAAIDVEATRHMGQAPVLNAWKQQTPFSFTAKRVMIEDGIDHLRSFFMPHPVYHSARIHIDNKCRGLISELGGCKSPLADEGKGAWRRRPDGKPEKANCCAMKALIYAIVSRYPLVPRRVSVGVTHPKLY